MKIEILVSQEPNIKKLTKELSSFFRENNVEGLSEEGDFYLIGGCGGRDIVPKNLNFKPLLWYKYDDELEEIGKNYGLSLHFDTRAYVD